MLLAKYATELKAAGLQRITVSLDTLDPDVFAKMSGGFGGVAEVLEGIEHARARRPRAHQDQHRRAARRQRSHRCSTCWRTSAAPASSCASSNTWTSARAITGSRALVVPSRELRGAHRTRAGRCAPLRRNYRGEVAERHAFDDGAGEIGFISSVSQPFCGDCSRARISSDGSFYTCLFATQGVDLRGRCAPAPATMSCSSSSAASGAAAAIATASCAPRCATPRACTRSR